MITASFNFSKNAKILCIGAHPDDIEIGCGGTVLRLIEEVPNIEVYWVIFSGNTERQNEARRSADVFLSKVTKKTVLLHNFRDSYFPFMGVELKDKFEVLKKELTPDLIFTHYRKDFHQDHRLICELTWNTFRNHLILEYEIPKYEGDLKTPNLYVPLSDSQVNSKINYLMRNFETQREKNWFTEETFKALLRLRGIECNSASEHAEGFHCNKMVL